MTVWCLEVYDTEMREARTRKYTRSQRTADTWKRIPKVQFTDSGHGLIFTATPHPYGGRRLPTINPYGYYKHEAEQREREKAYERDYNRGWRAAINRSTDGALDKADKVKEPEAWYDGYFDGAAGREKWHLRDCDRHHNLPGGCGVA